MSKFDYKEREAEFARDFGFFLTEQGRAAPTVTEGYIKDFKAFMKQTLRLYIGSVRERVTSNKLRNCVYGDSGCHSCDGYNAASDNTIKMLDQDEEDIK